MGSAAFRRGYLGKQAADTVAVTPTRLVECDFTLTGEHEIIDIDTLHAGTRAMTTDRVRTGWRSNVTATTPLTFETLPFFLSMCIAGGGNVIKTYLDEVTDPNANAGTVANPDSPQSVARYMVSALPTENPTLDRYTLVYGDGDKWLQLIGLHATNVRIEVSATGVPQITFNGVAQYYTELQNFVPPASA